MIQFRPKLQEPRPPVDKEQVTEGAGYGEARIPPRPTKSLRDLAANSRKPCPLMTLLWIRNRSLASGCSFVIPELQFGIIAFKLAAFAFTCPNGTNPGLARGDAMETPAEAHTVSFA